MIADRLDPRLSLSQAEREGTRAYASTYPGFVESLLDGDGKPPCDPPDDCPTCRLFSGQRPDESRRAWLARITGGRS